MKAKKHNYKNIGQTELKGGHNGEGVLSIYAFTPGDKPVEIDFQIDDWNVAKLAKGIRKYMANKQEQFIREQRQLRIAMGYATSEPSVDYGSPKL